MDGVNIFHADKDETIVQVDTINLGVHGWACPTYPVYYVGLQNLCHISRRK